MTTGELFDKITAILKEKGRLPEILDYGLGTYRPVPIKTCEFELKSHLAYGGSEGIYLDLWIAYFTDGERRISSIGTFKTLDKSREAMHRMAALLADFILAVNAYVNENLDDITREGADVYPKRKDELIKKYQQVVVRDNATRKEKVFKGAGIPQT